VAIPQRIWIGHERKSNITPRNPLKKEGTVYPFRNRRDLKVGTDKPSPPGEGGLDDRDVVDITGLKNKKGADCSAPF
jgi:hypothetical protein